MAGHAQLTFVMTECSKTQIRLTGLIFIFIIVSFIFLLISVRSTNYLSIMTTAKLYYFLTEFRFKTTVSSIYAITYLIKPLNGQTKFENKDVLKFFK